MHKLVLYTTLYCCAAPLVYATRFGYGPCPEHSVQTNYDLDKYLGFWHEAARTNGPGELDLICVTAEYTLADDNWIEVLNRGYHCRAQKFITATVRAIQMNDTLGVWGMKFHQWQEKLSAYDVIKTDYDYSLVYSCRDMFLMHYYNAWILTRSPTPDLDKLEEYRNLALEMNLVGEDELYNVETSKCDNPVCGATN